MIDKIFIVHYEPLVERKSYLDSIIVNLDIPYEYLISNDESDSRITLNNYYKFNESIFNRKLISGEIFVTINHFLIYEKILDNSYNNCLILEDDAILKDNFFEYFEKIIKELKEVKFDICFLSDCCNLHSNSIQNGKHLYQSETSRSACGYIINSNCLKKIINTLPFNEPIDWHLNRIRKDLNLKYYWSEPTIIGQGSENIYKSNLRDKIK